MALLDGDEVRATGSARPPAEGLLRLIDELSERAGGFEPELVAIGVGPGSFTGTRVGLATAKGLAIARRMPLVGVCSLVGLARSIGVGPIAVTSDAGRGEVYVAMYSIDLDAPAEEIVAPFLATSDALELDVPPRDFGRAPLADLAVHVGIEGRLRAERFGVDDTARLEPLYVRPSDAKLPATPLQVSSSSSSKSDA